MKRFLPACFFLLIAGPYGFAQTPESLNASQILLQMKKLNVLGSVLYIAAHPDDENTRLLAWLSQEKLYRTGYLSLTRGDGGQNLLGDEQGIELGLIRTQELLAARRIDGAEQFFSRAFDFGFSKTTEESLRFWDKQKILSDVVWVIRKFQPDVIITRFPEDKRAGHGQHSASSVLAHLAFAAAADPKQFPEQFRYGVSPWQATRLLWNNYNFGGLNTTRDDQLKIEVGGFNPLLGKSYGEVAADSRSQHRSQGFGVARSHGHALEYFSLTEGKGAEKSLMDDVDYSWKRLPGGSAIETLINGMIKNYDPSDPSKSLRDLLTIYQRIKELPDGYWKKKKQDEVQKLMEACSGLSLEATVHQPYAVQGQEVTVGLQVINRSRANITLNGVTLNQTDTAWNQTLEPDENYTLSLRVSLAGIPISQPYWLKEPMSAGSYNVDDQMLIGDPQNKPALMADFRISLPGLSFVIRKPVVYDFTEPAKGEAFEPFVIIPKSLASCNPQVLLFSGKKEKDLEVSIQLKQASGSPAVSAPVSLTPSPDFKIRPDQSSSSGSVYHFRIEPTDGNQRPEWTWATKASGNQTDTLLQCRTISYEHIPRIDYFKPVRAKLVSTDLQIRGSRVGYIEGAGDKVPDALREMGFAVTILNENNLTASVLQTLDAVIAGVRAYDVHDWLFSKYEVLTDYVKNGGNLIVQYNRNNSENARTRIGPYPFSISNARVTEEDAAVNFVHPEDPVLHFPNQITDKDFEGWIQERGIYFATHADPQYREIFSMHDTGEQDQKGSLITAAYGKGNFTYTGIVFFRELPAGVPGAYRLLANLIAQNQNKNK
ncbi:MAG: PIG-L family deacetylase [Bacteroidota bacterium]|nr:PIG-L family deacetylase [Bacteroidota bacterium]MDP4212853.1 PIG-L family deacetylase [Bacteroidota bacterium]MDP4250357.1 PIG-L family deacetylase [Bacteroidota bacterium]